ncbi:hypothetical protein P691DRAFT_769057 [Macrolepiota fuliginosa MF-IS2]|uniref:Uncharacterized protein n=1 Tax=Macrolepiota fuliginosa MF-IS2 TaxID=1400762 RepID=A0A9P6BVT9_9AGAR|nr:hypothetical protein P691DRAFT_769057 [Macrolepiota fuliginosa MF-IS2]
MAIDHVGHNNASIYQEIIQYQQMFLLAKQKLINVELYTNLTHLPEHMVEYTKKDKEKPKNSEQTLNPFSPSETDNYPPMFATKPLEQAKLYTVNKLNLKTPAKPTEPQQYIPPQSRTPPSNLMSKPGPPTASTHHNSTISNQQSMDPNFNLSLNNLPPSVIIAVKKAITNEIADSTNANTATFNNPDITPLSVLYLWIVVPPLVSYTSSYLYLILEHMN